MKKPKNSKPKKKWSKQCGDFSFKNATQNKEGSISAEVFFKDEFVGMISCIYRNNKHNYSLGIHDFSLERGGTAVGFIECSGSIHGLPKSITRVELKRNSILSLNRKVLIEKCKPIEEFEWKAITGYNFGLIAGLPFVQHYE